MPKRTLGRTGLEVSVVGYGTAELRGRNWRIPGRTVTPELARLMLNAVLDAGISFIDTSIDYGGAEELIGREISGRRAEYCLASKCGCLTNPAEFLPENRGKHDYRHSNIVAGVEQSLRRLKTDYLDLVQLHGSPSRAELVEGRAIEALQELQRAGKVRWIGTSSTLPNVIGLIAMGVFDVFQIPYSALERGYENIISDAAATGAGILIRGTLAQGMTHDGMRPVWADGRSPASTWEKAGLDELLGGMTRMEFLARYAISHPNVHCALVGTISPRHLLENIDAFGKGPLPLDIYAEAKQRLALAGEAPLNTRE